MLGNFVTQMCVLASYFNMFFLKNIILKQFLTIQNGSFYLIEKKNMQKAVYFFKNSFLNLQKNLLDIVVIDNGCKKNRYLIILILGNFELSTKTHICVYAEDGEEVKSLCKMYVSSNWLEREGWDLMGINFSEKNKKRILSDYNSKGHPLKKNFPKSGFYESKKKENIKINIKKKTKTLQKKFKKISAYA